jgi:hypothetical protein
MNWMLAPQTPQEPKRGLYNRGSGSGDGWQDVVSRGGVGLHLGEVSPVGGFVGGGVKDGDDILAGADRQPREGVLGGLGDQRGEWGRACMAEEGGGADAGSDRCRWTRIGKTTRWPRRADPVRACRPVAVHLVRRGSRRLGASVCARR